MQRWVILALLAVCVIADTRFDNFLKKYGKSYNGAEYLRRQKIYHANLREAAKLNAQNGNPAFGETKFSDLTAEEFQSQYLMAPMPKLAQACMIYPDYLPNPLETPAAWDWTDTSLTGREHIVSAVKDQGSCGSCWAFSASQAIEGQIGMMGLYDQWRDSVSAQFIVDCSKGCTSENYYNQNYTVCNGGCNGGWPWTAFNDMFNTAESSYIGGAPTETNYPYAGYQKTCTTPKKPIVNLGGYACITTGDMQTGVDEKVIADYLYAVGPLSIAVNANPFYLYTGGVLNIPCADNGYLNHAVLLVGYGHDSASGLDYWKIKNSWGASWGEAGYVRMAKGKELCGINEAVSYPTLPSIQG